MKLLTVLAGGGHTTETLMLVDHLGGEFEYIYLINEGDELSGKAIRYEGSIVSVPPPGRWGEGAIAFIWKGLISLMRCMGAIISSEADAVISVGKDITVPATLAGKLLGKKVIYVESMQKVYTPSLSARIVVHYADLFFVQWPNQEQSFKDAIYAGRLA